MSRGTGVLFLDTAFVFARLNTRDARHRVAIEWERKLATERRPLITSEYVLVEIADGLAAVRFRVQALRTIDILRSRRHVEVVPASAQLFQQALDLYRARRDKDWSLTDCSSFVIMSARGISEALTTDKHFGQAGFVALLLDSGA